MLRTMRIIKKAVEIGNGAAVYVPREYGGREVVVILPEGVEGIKRRVIEGLMDIMDNIVGIYMFGSYAREEQDAGSDIDVLIVVKEKDERIKGALEGIDARVVTLEGIRRAIKENPLLIMPILREAKVILNPILLEELKNSKIDFSKFRWHFDDIRRIIKIIEGFVELDDKDIDISHVYSLIMRIRTCYLMECLIKNKEFSNESVRKIIMREGFSEKEADRLISIYRRIRDGERVKDKIGKEEILKLIGLINKYLKRIESETKKKACKRN